MSSPPTMGIGTSSSSRGTPAPRTRMLTQFIVTRLSWGGLPGAGAQPASSAANDPRRGPMHVIFWGTARPRQVLLLGLPGGHVASEKETSENRALGFGVSFL